VPLPRYLANLRRHHANHHLVDNGSWLAFCVPAVDDLFGTRPDIRDVKARRRAAGGSRAPARARRGDRVLLKAAASDEVERPRTLRDEVPALARMARPPTIPMGIGLVGVGAYGARAALTPGWAGRVALGGVLTALVGVGVDARRAEGIDARPRTPRLPAGHRGLDGH